MADFSEAAETAADALNEGQLAEEYEHGPNGLRVKRGPVKDQLDNALKLNALAARQSRGSIFIRPIIAEETQ